MNGNIESYLLSLDCEIEQAVSEAMNASDVANKAECHALTAQRILRIVTSILKVNAIDETEQEKYELSHDGEVFFTGTYDESCSLLSDMQHVAAEGAIECEDLGITRKAKHKQ